jgi:hypothetical protein
MLHLPKFVGNAVTEIAAAVELAPKLARGRGPHNPRPFWSPFLRANLAVVPQVEHKEWECLSIEQAM